MNINIEGIPEYGEKYIDPEVEPDPIEFWHDHKINYEINK